MNNYHELYKDYEYYEEQGETSNYTTSGADLRRMAPVAEIPDYDGGFAAVNWNPMTNSFVICKPGMEDFHIQRTEETLRALAKILAFNPKEWGCSECGCSTEFKDYEYICWCDTCKDGCSSPVQQEPLPPAEPRQKSRFFSKRLPPLNEPLVRLTAEPKQTQEVIMSDDERDQWFQNAEDRTKMMFRS